MSETFILPDQTPALRQTKPTAWDELVASVTIDEGAPTEAQQQAVTEVWDKTLELTPSAHEQNLYYGFGKITCGFIRGLHGQKGRNVFVTNAACLLTFDHTTSCMVNRWDPQRGLYVNQLTAGYEGLTSRLGQLVAGYAAIPLADRLVTDVLYQSRPLGLGRPFRQAGNIGIETVLTKSITFDVVRRAALSGAMTVARRALIQLHERATGKQLADEQVHNLPVATIADDMAVSKLKLTKASRLAASLRLDEFQQGIGSLLCAIAPDEIYLDRSAILRSPGPIRQPKHKGVMPTRHHERLGCPALYVAGAIPFVAQAVPDIINTAQRELLRFTPL